MKWVIASGEVLADRIGCIRPCVAGERVSELPPF